MVCTENTRVGYGDVGEDLLATNEALLRLFENITFTHSEQANDPPDASDERWILTAYRVNVVRRPKHRELLTVRTWGRHTQGLIAAREFEILDAGGELIVCALSNWIRMNVLTGRPVRIPAGYAAAYGIEPDRTNFGDPWIGRETVPDSSPCGEVRVPLYFADANHHLNNANYLPLLREFCPAAFPDTSSACRFEILYRKAVLCGSTVQVCRAVTDGCCTILVRNGAAPAPLTIIRIFG